MLTGKHRTPPSLTPWRALVTVDEVRDDFFYVRVPGWDPRTTTRVPLDFAPQEVRRRIVAGQRYFHAQVNLGAEHHKDLYFMEWEEG